MFQENMFQGAEFETYIRIGLYIKTGAQGARGPGRSKGQHYLEG